MKPVNINYLGQTRLWWVVMAIGILLVISGFTYWFWPEVGYAVASQIFGWLLILAGVVQLCVAAGPDHARGWGWWIAGGVIDMFIGFMLVRSVILSELVFPYFLSIIFIFWGIEAFISAAAGRRAKSGGSESSTASFFASSASSLSKPDGLATCSWYRSLLL